MPRRFSSQTTRTDQKQPLSPSVARFLEQYLAKEAAERQKSQSMQNALQPNDRAASVAGFMAYSERLKQLPPEERLKDEGERLFSDILKTPNTFLVLQITPNPPVFRRARCRASECFYDHSDNDRATEIRDKYRIAIQWSGGSRTWFYHIRCMEYMISLPPLACSRLKLDGNSVWGLMIGKWMEHQGRINAESIVAYVDRETAWSRWYGDTMKEYSTLFIEHQFSHSAEPPLCGCPIFPESPKVPILKDYVTKGSCKLSDVLHHPYANKGRFFTDDNPPWARESAEDVELGAGSLDADESSMAKSGSIGSH